MGGRGTGPAGRTVLVSARRWKAARTGIEPLRALQAVRESRGASGAIYVCINEVSEGARRFADDKGITIWQAGEVAHALHGLPMGER